MKTIYLFKTIAFIVLAFFYTTLGFTQVPTDYYDTTEGKTSFELKTSLSFIIDNHTDRGYNSLWDLYPISDKRPDGFVWDIYSNCDLTFGTDQDNGSGGTSLCDKYNREHTFPQSWFNSLSTPRADAHMVMPTDKKMNSERGNFPYGETNGSEISTQDGNGARKGTNTLSGYSGTVFEPADEYKGDIARIYFYMATRYESLIDGWESNSTEANVVLNGTESQAYEDWVINMLISWHQNDPVSQKETDRNEAVYDYQGNRNPFIDHPEWVSCIWLNSCGNEPIPKLESNITSISFGDFAYGSEPVVKSFTLSGIDLTNAMTISLNSEDFLISTNPNSGFNTSLNINPNAEGIIEQAIYVLLDPQENLDQQLNGTITVTQSEVEKINIQLSAQVFQVVTSNIVLNFMVDTVLATIDEPIYQLTVQADKKIEETLEIGLKLSNFDNIFYPAQFTTIPSGEGTSVNMTMESGDSLSSLTINLDTAQLKTIENKTFEISIIENGNYLIGKENKIIFFLEGFNPPITANRNKYLNDKSLKQNPVRDKLYFTEPISDLHYKVINKSGQTVQKNNLSNVHSIDVGSLTPGLYYLYVIETKESAASVYKFIKH